jgi:hypothetical protein
LKSPNSRAFGEGASARFYDLARACPAVPPHACPIALSSPKTTRASSGIERMRRAASAEEFDEPKREF